MSAGRRRAWLRWAAVTGAVAALCALPLAVQALPVPAAAIGAAALRARILASARVPYQGYAESVVTLGVPQLPGLGSVSTLLDGTTDQYAWYASPARWRSAVLTPAGEDDTYRARGSSYVWAYARNLLLRITGAAPARLPRAADLLPPELGRRLLALAGRTGRVARLPARRIAGIGAAGLRIRPADPRTTVAAVDVWADPATGLPVSAEVFARSGGGPVLACRFLELSEAPPPALAVRPDPAPGVSTVTAGAPGVSSILNGIGPALPGRLAGLPRAQVPGGLASVAAYGTGFTRFAVIPLPGQLGVQALDAALRAGATRALVPDGAAVLLRSPLLTVALASSRFGGPVFLLAGAVTPRVLLRAAGGLMAALP